MEGTLNRGYEATQGTNKPNSLVYVLKQESKRVFCSVTPYSLVVVHGLFTVL